MAILVDRSPEWNKMACDDFFPLTHTVEANSKDNETLEHIKKHKPSVDKFEAAEPLA